MHITELRTVVLNSQSSFLYSFLETAEIGNKFSTFTHFMNENKISRRLDELENDDNQY